MEHQEAGSEASHISQLTPELLARVLSHLPLQQRLQDCAVVSKGWHKAVIMATTAVHLRPCPQDKCDEVSAWLQAHGDAAAISSLKIRDGSQPPATLQFPTQALRDLRELVLCGLQVAPADPPGMFGDSAAPVLLGLALLTSLELNHCQLTLRGLEGLTSLRRLFIKNLTNDPLREGNRILVAAALPALTNLTSLILDGPVATGTFSQPCSTLQRLEHLALCGDGTTAALMSPLHPALTVLFITCPLRGENAQEDVTTTSAQGLCEATGLQMLTLNGISTFHPAVLAKLRGLRRLSVSCEHMVKEPGTQGLAILSTLTDLQELKLYCRDLAPAVTSPEDYTTLTASSQLTALEAVRLPAEAYRAVFPPGCHLPHMHALTCGPQLLTDHAALQRVIASCPNLATFKQVYGGPEGEAAGADAEAVVEGLRLLSRFPQLVELEVVEVVLPRLAWRTMAQLSGLRSLELQNSSLRCMTGVLELTACRSLTRLQTETFLPEYSAVVGIKLQNQAPADSPPDVWRRLPAAWLLEASSQQRRYQNEPEANHAFSIFLREISEDAALSLMNVQNEHEEQVYRLQQQMELTQEAVAAVVQQLQEMQQRMQ